MSDREIFDTIASAEGWYERTQIDILLQYIENQSSPDAFADFLAQMRSYRLDENWGNDDLGDGREQEVE
ncbi:MAG: hypothetical protein H6921_14735 [Sphingomonas sp.]|nr:hypothetical protein [Sphingomonas sp.]